MKYLFSAVVAGSLLMAGASAFAQGPKKDLAIEDIWLNSPFRPEYVYGLRSMNDGKHYTVKEIRNNDTFIIKYEYKSGKAVDTVLRSSQLIPADSKVPISIDDYSFSGD